MQEEQELSGLIVVPTDMYHAIHGRTEFHLQFGGGVTVGSFTWRFPSLMKAWLAVIKGEKIKHEVADPNRPDRMRHRMLMAVGCPYVHTNDFMAGVIRHNRHAFPNSVNESMFNRLRYIREAARIAKQWRDGVEQRAQEKLTAMREAEGVVA